jgi:putrescine transport system substrate-binding protein
VMWFDMMAIPADAPNPSGALKFINFMMAPENIALASNYVYYANGNLGSQKYLSKDVIDDPAIYPPEATMNNLYTIKAYPPKVQRVVTRLWTRVKSGT